MKVWNMIQYIVTKNDHENTRRKHKNNQNIGNGHINDQIMNVLAHNVFDSEEDNTHITEKTKSTNQ